VRREFNDTFGIDQYRSIDQGKLFFDAMIDTSFDMVAAFTFTTIALVTEITATYQRNFSAK